MMKKTIFYLFCSLSLMSQAQRENIVSFRDNLVLTSVLNTKSEGFEFTNSLDQTMEYSTAPITGVGLGVDYKWFTFEYSKRLNSASNDGLYGHTENFGIGFGFTMPKWYFRNFLEQYSGYHLTNPDFIRFGYLDSAGMYPYRPDITTVRYYASFNWVFNSDNYSSMASLWQLERQEKSAGSFILGATFGRSVLFGDSTFVPFPQRENFPDIRDINAMTASTFTVNTGYQYTFVLSNSKKWFLHLGINPGLGFGFGSAYENVNDNFIEYPTRLAFSNEGRFIVGYNGDKWYFGYTAINYLTVDASSNANPLSNFNNYNRLYLGYRFTLPKRVSESLEIIGL